MSPLFRKKPVVVEAWQVSKENISTLAVLCRAEGVVDVGGRLSIPVPTLEGALAAQIGDWLIRGVAGEFYPCKPDIFAATYEPVADQAVAERSVADPSRPEGPTDGGAA